MSIEHWNRMMAEKEAYEREAQAFEGFSTGAMILACKAAKAEKARRELSDEAWAAVGSLDAAKLAAAFEKSVVFEKGRRVSELGFLGARQNYGEEDGDAVWTIFDAWLNGVESRWYGPPRQRDDPPESIGEKEKRLEELKKKAFDVAKLLDFNGVRLRGGPVEPSGEPASANSIRKERLMDAQWWSACKDKRIENLGIDEILVDLLAEWAAEDPKAGGLSVEDWRGAIVEAAKNNPSLAFRAEKGLRERTGKTLAAEGWAELIAGASLRQEAMAAQPAVEEAVAEEDKALSAWSSGWLMCYAIKVNSIQMLENIARRCPKMHWRAPTEAWGWVSDEKRTILMSKANGPTQKLAPLPMFHFAVMAASPSNSSWPIMNILAQSATMAEEAHKNKNVDIFKDYYYSDFVRLTAAFPFLSARDERGNSVAHAWARDAVDLSSKQLKYAARVKVAKTLSELLSSQDSHFISEANDAGETPLEILASCPRGDWTTEWEAKYSEWERSEMEKSAKPSLAAMGAVGRL